MNTHDDAATPAHRAAQVTVEAAQNTHREPTARGSSAPRSRPPTPVAPALVGQGFVDPHPTHIAADEAGRDWVTDQDFQRGYLVAGHQSQSPQNVDGPWSPVPIR